MRGSNVTATLAGAEMMHGHIESHLIATMLTLMVHLMVLSVLIGGPIRTTRPAAGGRPPHHRRQAARSR